MVDLTNKRILFAAHFSAPYKGNFLLSLEALEKKLNNEYNATCGYLFPKKAENQPWFADFKKLHKVYLSGNDNELISLEESDNIIVDFQPDIIHTHFEGYDTPMFYSARKRSNETKVVWHMHDTLKFHPNPIKAIYQLYFFYQHYGRPFINFPKNLRPSIIAVNPHELRFIAKFRGNIKTEQSLIANGVDTSRLSIRSKKDENIFTFLAYGGRNIQKRIDLIYKASEILTSKRLNFKLIVTKGTDTQEVADKYFGPVKPNWLQLIDQVSDINLLLNKTDCFICSSVNEGCSYAIIEAILKGVPVIQSEIEGTIWTRNYPSVKNFTNLDYHELAIKMEEMINTDKVNLLGKCQKTLKLAQNYFSLGNWCEKILDFYKTL